MPANRRTLRLRGLLLAALYLAFPAGVFGVRPCSHHDAPPASAEAGHCDTAAAAPAPEAGQAGHAAHGGHGGHDAAPAAHAPAGHHGPDEHGGCACIGACSPAGAAVLPEPPPAQDTEELTEVPRPEPAAGDDSVPTHLVPHVLPWSVGPPVIDPV